MFPSPSWVNSTTPTASTSRLTQIDRFNRLLIARSILVVILVQMPGEDLPRLSPGLAAQEGAKGPAGRHPRGGIGAFRNLPHATKAARPPRITCKIGGWPRER